VNQRGTPGCGFTNQIKSLNRGGGKIGARESAKSPISCEEDNGVDFEHEHEREQEQENETSGEMAEAGRAL
jgi:hypothetical protein